MKKLLVSAFVLLAACTSLKDLQREEYKEYNNRSEQYLINKLGVPSKSYKAGDSKFMVYSRPSLSADAVTTASTNADDMQCLETFEIKNGVVVGYQLEGEDCSK